MGVRALGLPGAIVIAVAVLAAPRSPKPLERRPLAYFEAACAGCHGEGGSWFPSNVAAGLSDADLTKKVETMARDHAARPVAGRDLAAQVALMRAIRAREPFVALVSLNTTTATFEVTPEAKLTARAGPRSLGASQTGNLWAVALRGRKAASVRVTATLGKKTATLDLGRADWSHTPAPAPPR